MMGIAANAMYVDWKYSGVKADQGSTVYVMVGAVAQTEWANLAAIQAAAVSSGTITKSGTKYTAKDTAKGDAITKDSANLYYVIVNSASDKFSVSDVVDAKTFVYDGDNQESAPLNGFEAIGSGNMSEPSSFGGGTGDVPEPTSAMLMLLGAAGLALKRKRA